MEKIKVIKRMAVYIVNCLVYGLMKQNTFILTQYPSVICYVCTYNKDIVWNAVVLLFVLNLSNSEINNYISFSYRWILRIIRTGYYFGSFLKSKVITFLLLLFLADFYSSTNRDAGEFQEERLGVEAVKSSSFLRFPPCSL